MKWLYFVLVFFLCQGAQGFNIFEKYPQLSTKVMDVTANTSLFEFTWDPVMNWDENDPIIGYKIIVQEMKGSDHNNHSEKVPEGLPKIFTASLDERKVVYEPVKIGVPYEVVTLSVTKKGDGPISPKSTFRLIPPRGK